MYSIAVLACLLQFPAVQLAAALCALTCDAGPLDTIGQGRPKDTRLLAHRILMVICCFFLSFVWLFAVTWLHHRA